MFYLTPTSQCSYETRIIYRQRKGTLKLFSCCFGPLTKKGASSLFFAGKREVWSVYIPLSTLISSFSLGKKYFIYWPHLTSGQGHSAGEGHLLLLFWAWDFTYCTAVVRSMRKQTSFGLLGSGHHPHSHLQAQASMLDSLSMFGKEISSPEVAWILSQILQSKLYQTSTSEHWPLNPIIRWGNLFPIWLAIVGCMPHWSEPQKAYPIVCHLNV